MVKISNKVLLAGGLATVVGFSGCKKYEDGPYFSLLTKKQRLTGDWEVKKLMSEGDNVIGNGVDVEMEFDKDGDFEISTQVTYTGYYGQIYSYSNTVKGEWEFSNNKEEIELDFDDGSYQEIEITRLTNKELEGELSQQNMNKIFPNTAARIASSAPGETNRFEAEKK
jgi:hypothetical protein